MKIKDPADAKEVAEKCIEKFVGGSLVYFNLFVTSEYSGSNCYFSPISTIKKDNSKMVFVDDIEKIIRLLLAHPKVSDLQYNPIENMISATFNDDLKPGLDEDEFGEV